MPAPSLAPTSRQHFVLYLLVGRISKERQTSRRSNECQKCRRVWPADGNIIIYLGLQVKTVWCGARLLCRLCRFYWRALCSHRVPECCRQGWTDLADFLVYETLRALLCVSVQNCAGPDVKFHEAKAPASESSGERFNQVCTSAYDGPFRRRIGLLRH